MSGLNLGAAVIDRVLGLVGDYQAGKIKREELSAALGQAVVDAFGAGWNPLAVAGLLLCAVLSAHLAYLGGWLTAMIGAMQPIYTEWAELVLTIEVALVVVLLGGNHRAFREVLFGIRDFLEERAKARERMRKERAGK